MDRIVSLVLLLACSLASHCKSLQEAVQQRRDVFGVYASDYTRGYEPMAFAAIPLHSPLPVLHIVSSDPLPMTHSRTPTSSSNVSPSYSHHHHSYIQAPSSVATSYSRQTHYRPSYPQQSSYVRHPETYQQPVAIVHQDTYDRPPIYRQPTIYAASIPRPINTEPQEPEDDAPTILYARPQPEGGYTYHRKPSKRRVPPKKVEPVIIRVHKYRVVKGR